MTSPSDHWPPQEPERGGRLGEHSAVRDGEAGHRGGGRGLRAGRRGLGASRLPYMLSSGVVSCLEGRILLPKSCVSFFAPCSFYSFISTENRTRASLDLSWAGCCGRGRRAWLRRAQAGAWEEWVCPPSGWAHCRLLSHNSQFSPGRRQSLLHGDSLSCLS